MIEVDFTVDIDMDDDGWDLSSIESADRSDGVPMSYKELASHPKFDEALEDAIDNYYDNMKYNYKGEKY